MTYAHTRRPTGTSFKGSARLVPGTVVRLPHKKLGDRLKVVQHLATQMKEGRDKASKTDTASASEETPNLV